ncbi:MAG: BlaI/MecI/CopY family transcriptional regulator [Bacteroidales bacterium]|nr:BlaI/MecI/CopY family transcriptional regulator [Bacteroidales bacterium]MBN2819032.1 BlaI/MecI/CopY family transcriptional regulator [Bacteroidales bacterium]
MKNKKNTPTTAELEILNVLWEDEPRSVKEIHKELSKVKNVGYTTTLKIMQNMTAKGMLDRKPEGKCHLYFTNIPKTDTQQNLINRLVDSAFGGSASSLVMQLLGNKKTSEKELNEIKRIIEEIEKNQ